MNKLDYNQIGGLQRKTMAIAHFLNYLLFRYSFKGAGMIGNLISKVLVPKPKGRVICPTIYNCSLIVDPIIGKGVEDQIYFRGFYEAGTIHVLSKCLRENDIFFDVGSNIGLMSIIASKFVGRNGKVYSFEPQQEVFSILQENIRLNQLENVYAYNVACGSTKQKRLVLYKNESINRGSASLIKLQEDSQKEEVSVETLDDFVCDVLAEHMINPRMIKIDVEGWDLEVLKGSKNLLSSPKAPIICIEYSHLHPVYNGRQLDIYYHILNINNYHIFKLKGGNERPSKLTRIQDESELPHHDNLFCFLPSHLESLPKEMFV